MFRYTAPALLALSVLTAGVAFAQPPLPNVKQVVNNLQIKNQKASSGR